MHAQFSYRYISYNIYIYIIYCIYIYTPTSPLLWLWGTQKESQKISVLLLLSPLSFRKKHRNTTREESSDVDSDADLHGDLEPGQFQFEPVAMGSGLVGNRY